MFPSEPQEDSYSGRLFGRPMNSCPCYQHKGSLELGDRDFEFKSGSVAALLLDLE